MKSLNFVLNLQVGVFHQYGKIICIFKYFLKIRVHVYSKTKSINMAEKDKEEYKSLIITPVSTPCPTFFPGIIWAYTHFGFLNYRVVPHVLFCNLLCFVLFFHPIRNQGQYLKINKYSSTCSILYN